MHLNKKGRKRGNRKAQLQRRRKRMKNLPERAEKEVQLIDGNWGFYPVAYCKRYKGHLTIGQMEVHNCTARECINLVMLNANDNLQPNKPS